MNKGFIVAIVVVCSLLVVCYAGASPYPKLSVRQISKDLTGKEVADWSFTRDDQKTIQILDGNYDGDMAEVHVYVLVIDGLGNHGRKGRLRLYYQWAEYYWKLMNIKPLVFLPW